MKLFWLGLRHGVRISLLEGWVGSAVYQLSGLDTVECTLEMAISESALRSIDTVHIISGKFINGNYRMGPAGLAAKIHKVRPVPW